MNSHEILVAIRRVTRAIDTRSKKLEREAGLTVPQLLVLQSIHEAGKLRVSHLAQSVSLSHATVTSILGRLSARGLINRKRDAEDRRAVSISLTAAGKKALKNAPGLLQDEFVARFDELQAWEQKMLTSAVERIASMMEEYEKEASPILQVGEILGEDARTGASARKSGLTPPS